MGIFGFGKKSSEKPVKEKKKPMFGKAKTSEEKSSEVRKKVRRKKVSQEDDILQEGQQTKGPIKQNWITEDIHRQEYREAQEPEDQMTPVYTKEESELIYNKKSMRQEIFLYASPEIFNPIVDYYTKNKYGIVMVGSNVITQVKDIYKSLMSRNIIIIHSNNDLSEQVADFITELLRFKTINPDGLKIHLILTEEINSKKFIEQYLKYTQTKLSIMAVPCKVTSFTASILDSLIAKIVEQQPVFDFGDDIPVKANVADKQDFITAENIFKLDDLSTMRKEIKNIKAMAVSDRVKQNTEVEKIIERGDINKGVKDLVECLPEARLLEMYDERLNEYLREVETTVNTTYDINKILDNSMEVSELKEHSINAIINNKLSTLLTKAKESEKRAREHSKAILTELSKNEEDVDILWQKRNELKENLMNSYADYKYNIQMISNTISLRKQLYIELQNEVANTIQPHMDKLNDKVVKKAIVLSKHFKESQLEYDKVSESIIKTFSDTVDFSNKLLKEANVIIEIDEIVVEKLQNENRQLKASNIQTVREVDTLLKEKGSLNFVLNVLSTTWILSNRSPRILYIAMGDVEIFNDAKPAGVEDVSIEDIDTVTWSNNNELPTVINACSATQENISAIIRFLPKLNYIARQYDKIVFLVDTTTDKNVIEAIREKIIAVNIFTDTSSENTLTANAINTELNIDGNDDKAHITFVIDILKKDKVDISQIRKELGTTVNPIGEVLISSEEVLEKAETDPNAIIDLQSLIYSII